MKSCAFSEYMDQGKLRWRYTTFPRYISPQSLIACQQGLLQLLSPGEQIPVPLFTYISELPGIHVMFSKTTCSQTLLVGAGGPAYFCLKASLHLRKETESPCPVSVRDSIGIPSSLGLGRKGCHLFHGEKRVQPYIINTGIPMLMILSLPSPAFLGGWEM